MINGRPQNGAWAALFNPIGLKDNFISLKYQNNVSGWCCHWIQCDENYNFKGKGKRLLRRGCLFIGDFKKV